MGAETMAFLLKKYLCFILYIVAAIQMQNSHAAVEYTVTNTAASTDGGIRFSTVMEDDDTVKALMDSATYFIWTTFQQTDQDDKKDVQLVVLFIEEMDDGKPPAYTFENEIHFNAGYIQRFSGDLRTEFTAILYHEMTHVWQWDGNGKANDNLIEGIADYITYKAGYARSYWPSEPGLGEEWDQGYEITAYFLDYCNNYYKMIMEDKVPADLLENGFVAELNRMMKDDYSDN